MLIDGTLILLYFIILTMYGIILSCLKLSLSCAKPIKLSESSRNMRNFPKLSMFYKSVHTTANPVCIVLTQGENCLSTGFHNSRCHFLVCVNLTGGTPLVE